MAHYWLKIYKNDKIFAEFAAENKNDICMDSFAEAARDAFGTLDLPTPVILKTHFNSLDKFNYVKILPADFVEKVNFDYATFEIY